MSSRTDRTAISLCGLVVLLLFVLHCDIGIAASIPSIEEDRVVVQSFSAYSLRYHHGYVTVQDIIVENNEHNGSDAEIAREVKARSRHHLLTVQIHYHVDSHRIGLLEEEFYRRSTPPLSSSSSNSFYAQWMSTKEMSIVLFGDLGSSSRNTEIQWRRDFEEWILDKSEGNVKLLDDDTFRCGDGECFHVYVSLFACIVYVK